MHGKIACLPKHIREQLNRRLDDAEPQHRLLAWLNSLPEAQGLLAASSGGQPLSKQNLHQWSRHGFRNWKMRQTALEFAALDDSDSPASQPGSAASLTDKLVQWLARRLAATAHTFAPNDEEDETDLRRLRNFAADIVALRRGDLYARRVALEEKRLAILQAGSEPQREKEFWEWTKRPDIRAQLDLEHHRTKSWYDTLRSSIPELAPFLPPREPDAPAEPDHLPDPAVLI